jgi:hypothetical protein
MISWQHKPLPERGKFGEVGIEDNKLDQGNWRPNINRELFTCLQIRMKLFPRHRLVLVCAKALI